MKVDCRRVVSAWAKYLRNSVKVASKQPADSQSSDPGSALETEKGTQKISSGTVRRLEEVEEF